MYFITIEELDIVVEQMRSKRVNLWSLLEKAKERDSVPDKQRFIFYQHLDAMGARALPAYIKDAKEKMILGLAESVGIPVPTNG